MMGLRTRVTNLQKGRRSYVVGQRHYDLGNQFFRAMLDDRITDSCGYWKNSDNLEDAPDAKLDLICRELDLQPGQRVLDIGCDWGSLADYAAEHYGAHVVGVMVSEEQSRYANERYRRLPVTVRVQDYREVRETFDHVVSAGMFEHVGYKNHRRQLEVVERCLGDQGTFLLHTIGRNTFAKSVDPWIEKYIFPNSMIPPAVQITAAAEGLFAIRDWHSFGRDYDPTPMAWHDNFEWNWELFADRLDERFRRMWRYYLLSSAGSFRADDNQLWQILFSKPGDDRQHLSMR
jgi:cyclopropane-fatty-acyl-phospholipid synthase